MLIDNKNTYLWCTVHKPEQSERGRGVGEPASSPSPPRQKQAAATWSIYKIMRLRSRDPVMMTSLWCIAFSPTRRFLPLWSQKSSLFSRFRGNRNGESYFSTNDSFMKSSSIYPKSFSFGAIFHPDDEGVWMKQTPLRLSSLRAADLERDLSLVVLEI